MRPENFHHDSTLTLILANFDHLEIDMQRRLFSFERKREQDVASVMRKHCFVMFAGECCSAKIETKCIYWKASIHLLMMLKEKTWLVGLVILTSILLQMNYSLTIEVLQNQVKVLVAKNVTTNFRSSQF